MLAKNEFKQQQQQKTHPKSSLNLPFIFFFECKRARSRRMHVSAYLNWVAEPKEENIAKFAHNMEKLFDDCAATCESILFENLRLSFGVQRFRTAHCTMQWLDEHICVNIIQAFILFGRFISEFSSHTYKLFAFVCST